MRRVNRRDFVKTVAGAGITYGLSSSWGSGTATSELPIALQLYTVRNLSQQDFRGTLKKVAEIGYRHVEFAGYGDLDANQLAAFLGSLQVTPCGTHEGYANLTKDLSGIIQFNRRIGTPYIVVPSMPQELRKGTASQLELFAEDLNRIGREVKNNGMQLCYHNHSFEFDRAGDKTLWEILFDNTDRDLVKAEVDIAWVYNANVDPVGFLEKWGDRIKLLHMKDLDDSRKLAPVGTGVIDLKGVVAKAREIGVEWYIVELDQPREGRPILDEVTIAYENLVGLLG